MKPSDDGTEICHWEEQPFCTYFRVLSVSFPDLDKPANRKAHFLKLPV